MASPPSAGFAAAIDSLDQTLTDLANPTGMAAGGEVKRQFAKFVFYVRREVPPGDPRAVVLSEFVDHCRTEYPLVIDRIVADLRSVERHRAIADTAHLQPMLPVVPGFADYVEGLGRGLIGTGLTAISVPWSIIASIGIIASVFDGAWPFLLFTNEDSLISVIFGPTIAAWGLTKSGFGQMGGKLAFRRALNQVKPKSSAVRVTCDALLANR